MVAADRLIRRHPDELYARRREGERPVRKTSSNPWLADLRFAAQEVIRFEARDGLQLEGILIYPHRNGWLTAYSSPGEVAAARGFAVFHPNGHSTGDV
jgi:hypothetical protein